MSEKILVVHNHPLIAESVRRVALEIGAQSLSCLCFADAKRLIEQWRPLLVLTDLALPDALGEELPSYAKKRGVTQVWALSQEYKRKAYRRAPSRDYCTDGWIALSEVARDLGPRVSSQWGEQFPGGRGGDTQGAMAKVCAAILRHSDEVQAWDLAQIRSAFDAWFPTLGHREHGLSEAECSAVDTLFYSAGLGALQSEAV